MNNNFSVVPDAPPNRSHFYVILNKTGQRMIAWGQFDPADPKASLFAPAEGETEFNPDDADNVPADDTPHRFRTRIARWAVTVPREDNGTAFRELSNGQFFWCGAAPNLQEAVKNCQARTTQV